MQFCVSFKKKQKPVSLKKTKEFGLKKQVDCFFQKNGFF